MDSSIFATYGPLLFRSGQATVELFVFSLLLGTGLGLVLALMRISPFRVLQTVALAFSWFFRSIPALVVLFFAYYGLPKLGLDLSPMEAGIMGLGIDAAAYKAEIIRSGLFAVGRGQWEAATALGMKRVHLMRRIILPQAIRIMIPPYFSNATALLKSTSLASVITVEEITGSANRFISSTFRPIEILLMVGAYYLLLNTTLVLAQHALEARFRLND